MSGLTATAGAAFPGRDGALVLSTETDSGRLAADGCATPRPRLLAHAADDDPSGPYDHCLGATVFWLDGPRGLGLRRVAVRAGIGRSASVSPDGRWIALSSPSPGSGSALVLRARPGTPARSIGHAGVQFVWAPDGQRLAFSTTNEHLYAVSVSGGPVRQLGAGVSPAWASTGALAFIRASGAAVLIPAGRRRLLTDLYTKQRDFCCEQRIQLWHAGRVLFPTDVDWSPDGKHLVLSAWQQRGARDSRLYIARANGTHVRLLARAAAHAIWSPSGREVAFGDGEDVYLVSARSTGPVPRARWRLIAAGAFLEDWQPVPASDH